MITKEQILNATGSDLSRIAGEVLGIKQMHSWPILLHYSNREKLCSRCKVKHKKAIEFTVCSVAGVVLLTWPEAMKWRDWAVKEYGEIEFTTTLRNIYFEEYFQGKRGFTFDVWLACIAQPEHFIKASCELKLGGE
jgi:hypothetical protein